MAGPDNAVLCWPPNRWPETDQAAWALGCTPGDPFDDPCHRVTLRRSSLAKVSKGYGRWLSFLDTRKWLDPSKAAPRRITRRRLRAYFHALRRAANADYTIIGRFSELALAMKILAPGENMSWIRHPDGVSIYTLLPRAKRHLMVPDSTVLFDWALRIMDEAEAEPSRYGRLAAHRDGLLLAMLAARGRRLRSMALLRPGRELIQREGHYRIELTPEQVKTGKPDRFDLPRRLTPYVRHYLEVVRPALLKGLPNDALWIGRPGKQLTAKAIQALTLRRTRQRFGQAFGPHRFRHAIGTTAALRDPGHPGLAAGVLGISDGVLEQHYNRAGQSQAAAKFADLIEQRRRLLP